MQTHLIKGVIFVTISSKRIEINLTAYISIFFIMKRK